MTAEASTSSASNTDRWNDIIQGAAQGAGSGMTAAAANSGSVAESREAKRRTLANIFNKAMKRRMALGKVKQEYGDEMNDYQSQAMQQVARGFAEALQGSGRG